MQSVAENVRSIQQNIRSVCKRIGRNSDEISLVAVTKIFPVEKIIEVNQSGIFDIGENFVQELREKKEKLSDEQIRWHFIGHLQKNKVKYIAPWIHLIHSVDSLELCEEINKRAIQHQRIIEVLIEVNSSNEESKYGVKPEGTLWLAKEMQKYSNIKLNGLMTMGPLSENAEDARSCFRMIRELRNEIQQSGINAQHLSMGMSGDYEIAIEEGATLLRLGTAIFGERIYQ
ncbi:MAG: YggS family pyridoxal phosphate-dependent enzyme [Ignavibacteriales bacterium]|nr:YggS family pyridoxal phosphate-dependent enzyme [Ignavibacteriales bacterium]